jgi:hypothetical protein
MDQPELLHEESDSNMDLGAEFEKILATYGHTVFLQRRKDASESGPYRMVSGGRYTPSVEKWTAYRWFPANVSGTFQNVKDVGWIDNVDAKFYFQPAADIKLGDLLSEPTPHERTERVSFRIEKVIPYYLSNRLIYLAAECKKMEPIS